MNDEYNVDFLVEENKFESHSKYEDKRKNGIFQLKLAKWWVKFLISQKCGEELLSILIEQGLKLPKTKKTLLKVKKHDYQTRDVPSGKYVHLGINFFFLNCYYMFSRES